MTMVPVTPRMLDMWKLIDEVERRPALYTRKIRGPDAQPVWEAVASTMLGAEYQALDDEDKAGICEQLKKKWKNLRDVFARKLKIQRQIESGEIIETDNWNKFVFYDRLLFLIPYVKSYNRESVTDKEDKIVNEDEDDHINTSGVNHDVGSENLHFNVVQNCKVMLPKYTVPELLHAKEEVLSIVDVTSEVDYNAVADSPTGDHLENGLDKLPTPETEMSLAPVPREENAPTSIARSGRQASEDVVGNTNQNNERKKRPYKRRKLAILRKDKRPKVTTEGDAPTITDSITASSGEAKLADDDVTTTTNNERKKRPYKRRKLAILHKDKRHKVTTEGDAPAITASSGEAKLADDDVTTTTNNERKKRPDKRQKPAILRKDKRSKAPLRVKKFPKEPLMRQNDALEYPHVKDVLTDRSEYPKRKSCDRSTVRNEPRLHYGDTKNEAATKNHLVNTLPTPTSQLNPSEEKSEKTLVSRRKPVDAEGDNINNERKKRPYVRRKPVVLRNNEIPEVTNVEGHRKELSPQKCNATEFVADEFDDIDDLYETEDAVSGYSSVEYDAPIDHQFENDHGELAPPSTELHQTVKNAKTDVGSTGRPAFRHVNNKATKKRRKKRKGVVWSHKKNRSHSLKHLVPLNQVKVQKANTNRRNILARANESKATCNHRKLNASKPETHIELTSNLQTGVVNSLHSGLDEINSSNLLTANNKTDKKPRGRPKSRPSIDSALPNSVGSSISASELSNSPSENGLDEQQDWSKKDRYGNNAFLMSCQPFMDQLSPSKCLKARFHILKLLHEINK